MLPRFKSQLSYEKTLTLSQNLWVTVKLKKLIGAPWRKSRITISEITYFIFLWRGKGRLNVCQFSFVHCHSYILNAFCPQDNIKSS